MTELHDSIARLLACAVEATARLPPSRQVHDTLEMRKALGWSSARLTNFNQRGLSKDAALEAQKLFRCSATWLMDGKGNRWTSQDTPLGGVATLAQQMTQASANIDPPTINQGSVLQLINESELPARFKLAITDDSMASSDGSSLSLGDFAIFDRQRPPKAGKNVLLSDAAGNVYIRRYAPRTPGHWAAVALNPAYQPLDSKSDGLTIIAAQVGYLEAE